MSQIIAITNQKGGVGKTTTSTNLSSGLAQAGYQVLLIDLDPQGQATIGLGIEPGSYKLAIHDVLINKKNLRDAILATKQENLSLVPSNLRLDRAEQQLSYQELWRESRLKKAIEKLAYDFIIIDCRPTLGTLTVNALVACDYVLVPCEMAPYSLEGFADLIETIQNVKNNEAEGLDNFLRILLTKFDARNTRTNSWVFQQLKPYETLVLTTKIRNNQALVQAQIAGQSIFTYEPASHGSQDYQALTKEILNLWQPKKT